MGTVYEFPLQITTKEQLNSIDFSMFFRKTALGKHVELISHPDDTDTTLLLQFFIQEEERDVLTADAIIKQLREILAANGYTLLKTVASQHITHPTA